MAVYDKQISLADESEEYREFVEKFKPKKTTDDCYTPQPIYDIILDYAATRFGFDKSAAVRPFYPGGDFERFDYPEGCVVVDNPPFSILSKIKRFYIDNGVRFFLFCPTLTAFSGSMTTEITHIITHAQITYENGAAVNTSFVTNMCGDIVAESEPVLTKMINAKDEELRKANNTELPKYEYPDSVLTSAKLGWLAAHGTAFSVRRCDCAFIRKLDTQTKGIFGGGLLLSERAAAERAAAQKFSLSERERDLQKMLGARP